MTMLEFASAIIKATGSKSKIIHKPLPQDDPQQRKPDITRAKKILDWEPVVTLEAGLAAAIEYFAKRI
jgi:nucleoside-diphosphate-sugar epimerase